MKIYKNSIKIKIRRLIYFMEYSKRKKKKKRNNRLRMKKNPYKIIYRSLQRATCTEVFIVAEITRVIFKLT